MSLAPRWAIEERASNLSLSAEIQGAPAQNRPLASRVLRASDAPANGKRTPRGATGHPGGLAKYAEKDGGRVGHQVVIANGEASMPPARQSRGEGIRRARPDDDTIDDHRPAVCSLQGRSRSVRQTESSPGVDRAILVAAIRPARGSCSRPRELFLSSAVLDRFDLDFVPGSGGAPPPRPHLTVSSGHRA